jgi:hypothetical protein
MIKEVDMACHIDFTDLGLCEGGQGTSRDPARREPGACPRQATNITEEGYRWCREHAESYYGCINIMQGVKVR